VNNAITHDNDAWPKINGWGDMGTLALTKGSHALHQEMHNLVFTGLVVFSGFVMSGLDQVSRILWDSGFWQKGT
jgi:hypothetical protein